MQFQGFSLAALESLLTPGVSERWAAVQAQLHPELAALGNDIAEAAASALPTSWPLYELSYKSVRAINRGQGRRDPIDEYHCAIDRPPRGASIYLGVSGAERKVLIGIQLWSHRKPELEALWTKARALWEPLFAAMPDIRLSGPRPTGPLAWIDAYLGPKGGTYLWAGWSYSWEEASSGGTAFGAKIISHAVALLPFNEALMEAASETPTSRALHELRPDYQTVFTSPPIETILATIAERGFVYPEPLVRAYHVALRSKPLLILSGISGTGKTRLTRLYADAIHSVAPGAENPFYQLVAVQPDWHNARDLLGYYNALTDRFQPTSTLLLLLRAAADPHNPYYLCLDELNLARPEYYLAPLLSAIETADHLIDLGIPGASALTPDGTAVPNPLRLPLNVHFIGTVNVDESTFALSDKLLDRANVIELRDVDLSALKARGTAPMPSEAWRILEELQPLLAQAGQPFGYRTVVEIARFLASAAGVLPPLEALDAQIKQKLLPKLRGDDTPRFRAALRAIETALATLPASVGKVRQMIERLEREGYTDFY